ncbi:MAG: 4Fe-4S binding protein [Chloroflexi bacterium]|nr:4Fe-4S binding protein [Chloroflexota bacterium]
MTQPQSKKDAYDIIITKLRYPASRTLRKIFELWATPEEAEVIVELPSSHMQFTGSTYSVTASGETPAGEIARKLNRDIKTVEEQLENLFQKGLIREIVTPEGKTHYTRIGGIEGISDSILFRFGPLYLEHDQNAPLHKHEFRDEKTREIADLWNKFFYEEWYRWERPMELIHRRMAVREEGAVTGNEAARTFGMMPCFSALVKSEPLGTEILADWDLREIARRGEAAGGMLTRCCTCRTRARHCDRPVWTCGASYEGMPGLPAWYSKDRRNTQKKLSAEEWLEGMGTNEIDLGMTHIGTAGRKGCTCCNDCCNWIAPLRLYTDPWEGAHPSPYRAIVNQEICEGCTKYCVPRCNFRVIVGRTDPSSGKVKAFIDLEKCVGCGQCVIGCPIEGAVKLELATKIGAPVSPMLARLKIPDRALNTTRLFGGLAEPGPFESPLSSDK